MAIYRRWVVDSNPEAVSDFYIGASVHFLINLSRILLLLVRKLLRIGCPRHVWNLPPDHFEEVLRYLKKKQKLFLFLWKRIFCVPIRNLTIKRQLT